MDKNDHNNLKAQLGVEVQRLLVDNDVDNAPDITGQILNLIELESAKSFITSADAADLRVLINKMINTAVNEVLQIKEHGARSTEARAAKSESDSARLLMASKFVELKRGL